ncbi:response regulator transcription factor [Clostridium sp. Marseille-P299]|uniref:response regulator transcription factor n=1 Tax=Clostridium sp. Marseille-P299 TaxID=1805477 RepID=UPI00082A0F98|nr:LuxR C-terminal-related transcriptional regulator [Clostridium sp. Marseille-P299]
MSDNSFVGMDFSLEEFQILWNNSEYSLCIYRITEDHEVVIEKANETYLKLFSLKESDYEKPVNALLPGQTIQGIANSMEVFFENQNKPLVTNREFEDVYGCAYWNVIHQLRKNKILCIGRKVYDLSVLTKKNLTDLSYPSLLVSLTNDNRYKIESFSEEYLQMAVHSWMYEGYLDEYPFAELNFKTTRVIDECIRLNQTIQYTDVVKIPGAKYFVLVTLVPIVHVDSTKVLIISKKSDTPITLNINDRLERFSTELIQYFNTRLVGICFMEITSIKSFEIILSNECFDEIINREVKMEEDIIKSSLFKQCILSRNAVRGYIQTKESREISAKYFVQIIPTVIDNVVSGILLTIDPEHQLPKIGSDLLLKLTKREREILAYVADGYTNKYISSKLNITEGTVKRIISNGYKKLGISSRVELAKIYLSE